MSTEKYAKNVKNNCHGKKYVLCLQFKSKINKKCGGTSVNQEICALFTIQVKKFAKNVAEKAYKS